MDHLRRSSLNTFGGWDGDRVVERRRDADWLEAALSSAEARLVTVWQTRSLVEDGDPLRPVLLPAADWSASLGGEQTILLGVLNEVAHFAVEIADESLARRLETETRGRYRTLRQVGNLMAEPDASLLAYARAMVYWHERHRFCGHCGTATEIREAGHVRYCRRCETQEFPRLDPAVIVLVEHEDRCLLGRQSFWDPGRYSCVAGFVEPGETLEAAVVREVFEETGVGIDRVRYQSSQPWPFPSSIMLGFRGRAGRDEITLGEELEDARWFSRERIRRELIDDSLRLSPPFSIAFRLIEDWYDEGEESLRSVPNWKSLWPSRTKD
ncbi:MAG: NAD(+) diphosphatase [Gammaproteobacteria bacterium]|nr:MAG: NAD(+) diphosphatase [Gammaproteobacteria bacterium]